VVDAAALRPGQRVLDVACGTGVLARAAAPRVGPDGRVAGLDPGAGMLAVARDAAPAIDWQQGVAEALPFADAAFDAVLSQFGLMFFTDRHGALREMLRVLAPGGRLAVAVWDGLERIPAYAAEVALLERMAGQEAADALRAPFVLGDRAALAALVEDAGAGDVGLTTLPGRADFPAVRVMVEADLRGWLPLLGVHLEESRITAVLAEAEHALRAWRTADGRVAFRIQAHLVTATRP
jgi:SAM-dependent methyltransferase